MQVRIKSDGTPAGTSITHTWGGEERPIKHVTAIDVEMRVNQLAKAQMTMFIEEIDVVAEAEFKKAMLPDGKWYRLTPMEDANVVG